MGEHTGVETGRAIADAYVTDSRTMRDNPDTAHVPAVAITAYHSANVAQEAIQAGFDAYFPKPIEATSFVRELERIINEQ